MNARAETWRAELASLCDAFAARAAGNDETDEFVTDNYRDLKASGMLAAAVPQAHGGYGLELAELCELLRTMARACPSTALALSMHTHQVAVAAWRLKHQNAPVAPMLEKVAREKVVIVSTGGGDWLDSSGAAAAVDGGFRVNARKPFSSAAPAGDLLSTSVAAGEEVIHFVIPLASAGVSVNPTWRAMGMKNTGSHEVVLENVFVPAAAVAVRRPRGKWHPLFHLLSILALPLIYSVYLGVAEAARDRALALVRKRRPEDQLLQLVGEMENQLAAARLAHADWVALGSAAKPGPESTSRAMTNRTLVARGVLGTVDAAMNVAGGLAYFRANGLERYFRDAQGARYHPLQEGLQKALTARHALGMEL